MSHSKTLFILALLLLNVGCHTAHSPMRRSVFVNADGEAETEPQSLSELANMLPEEGTELTQSLLMLAKEGAPKDELLTFVRDLKSTIAPWHSNATAMLKKAIDAVHQCSTNMEGDVAHSQTNKNECGEQSNSHTSHRTEESSKLTTTEHWKAQTAEQKQTMESKCGDFSAVEVEAKQTTASYESHGGGDEELFLESVCERFSGLLPRYEDAKEKCTTAEADHADVSAKYETATTAYTVQVNAGNTIQTEMDVACCQYALATQDTCDSYGTCYEDKVAEYNSVKEVVEAEEKAKKVEWRVYSRIECLLPVLGTNQAAKIEECRAKTHSTSHLDIEYPTIPEKSTCKVEQDFPGTEAYKNAHYASLPDTAKGEPVAQCVGMTAVMTAGAAPYCVDIVTGTAAHNGGTMDVHIDAGNGLEVAATGMHAVGSTVVHNCFETPVSSVQVKNPTNDAWTGAIKYSTDRGTTYSSMLCASGCQAGQSTDGIVVDGNEDGSGQAATHCLSGSTCTITKA